MREKGIPFYPNGRNDLGRTAATTRTDIFVQHDFTFGRHRFNIGLNVENLFDQDTVTRLFTILYRDTFNVSDQVFFSGTFDPVALQASAPVTYPPAAVRPGGSVDAAPRNAVAAQGLVLKSTRVRQGR